jgi:hypothetical protein
METIEARISIVITEEAAKDEKKLQEQMRSLSNEIYKVCGVPPHVLVEVGNKPTQFTPAQIEPKEGFLERIQEELRREEAIYRRRQGR